jgi:chemotaxis protein MotB
MVMSDAKYELCIETGSAGHGRGGGIAMKDHTPAMIIKRKNKDRATHHRVAWEVVYADFGTALMACFLAMWFTGQKPAVKAAVAGYIRDLGVFDYQKSQGILPPRDTPGIEPGQPLVPATDPASLVNERQVLADAAGRIRQELMQVKAFKTLRDQTEIIVTAEGLRIELVERPGSSFFDSGSSLLRGESEQILTVIGHELAKLANDVVVEGHTDGSKYANGERYGNWELAVDRANAARRVLEHAPLRARQVRSVRGFADTQPHLASDPLDPRNRRLSIFARSQAVAALE